MSLIVKAELKSDWLNIASANTSKDAILDRLILAVESEIAGICNQPIQTTTVTLEFDGEGSNVYPLYYTVPVTLTTLKVRDTPSDAWALVTGDTAAFLRNGIYALYYEDGFSESPFYQAIMSVGYSTIPDDIKLCAYEMATELYMNTPHAMEINRFGVSIINESSGGVSIAKTIASMRDRAKARLRPYTRTLI